MSNISEVKIGSIIRVKVGKNLIHAKVIQILEDGLRVCSLARNKEFNVPSSRVELGGEASEQEQPVTPANTEAAEQVETEEQTEATEQAEQPAEQAAAEPETVEPATVEVLPEDEAAEFTPSGEDEEDEYAINPAHESDKPVKRLSLLNAAVIVLKGAGPDHPKGDSRSHPRTSALDADRLQDAGTDPLRKHLPRDRYEGTPPHREERCQG